VTTHLETIRGRKLLVAQQVIKLVLGAGLKGLGVCGGAAEGRDEIFVMPGLDVVVAGVHAVDETLDGVPVVAEDESVLMGA
jgi:hypothetical protein